MTATLPSITSEDRRRVATAAVEAYNVSTRATYGAGLKLYMDVCDAKGIPDSERAPASRELLAVFLAQLVGAYSASAAKNYYSGLRAWHIIHGLAWPDDRLRLDALLRAAANMAPEGATQSQKQPYMVDDLRRIQAQLNRDVPLDAAVAAVANVLFFGLGRLGELTIRKHKDFSAAVHVTIRGLSTGTDREGRPVWNLFIPKTKVARNGEKIQWARQVGLIDPVDALDSHLRLNQPTAQEHLFTYQTTYRNGRRKRIPLTRDAFLERIRKAAADAGVPPLGGHAFRIGGTLEYLLRQVPFEVVKAHGRWKGDSFQLYLRRHSQILAPFLQAIPETHAGFVGSMLPRVR